MAADSKSASSLRSLPQLPLNFQFNISVHLCCASIAVVGAADLDDPCGLSLFPAYANFLNVYGKINLID